jgi:hypothetical protein
MGGEVQRASAQGGCRKEAKSMQHFRPLPHPHLAAKKPGNPGTLPRARPHLISRVLSRVSGHSASISSASGPTVTKRTLSSLVSWLRPQNSPGMVPGYSISSRVRALVRWREGGKERKG